MNVQNLRKTLQEQMERLNSDNMTPEKLKLEIEKSKAMSELGQVIINTAKAEIDFLKTTKSSDSQFFKAIELPISIEIPKSNIVIPVETAKK
jgi:hypothetical protein